MKNRFILLLLSLLGLATACGGDQHEEEMPLPEYGCPHIRFQVKGRVTDPAGNPVEAIRITTGTASEVHTSATGEYLVEGETFPYSVELRFTDTDGPANGGSFAEKVVTVDFSEEDRTKPGDAGWYDGAFAKEADVRLEPDTKP